MRTLVFKDIILRVHSLSYDSRSFFYNRVACSPVSVADRTTPTLLFICIPVAVGMGMLLCSLPVDMSDLCPVLLFKVALGSSKQ
jgi:hypothetical protein